MYAQRLDQLRAEMKAHQVQGFLVPQTDAFMGEYIPKSAERLAWISGFTGSAGMAVILVDKAVAFTDNRYAIQIMQEVDGGLYDYADMVQTRVHAWIKENGDDRDIIAYDPWLHTHAQIKNLEDNDVSLKAVETNLIDNVWIDQPRVPSEPVFSFSDETAGRTAGDKRKLVAEELVGAGLDAFVIADPQSIAWLLNVRSTDVPCTPLPLSYAVIYADSSVDWFIAESRVPEDVKNRLGSAVSIIAPDTLVQRFAEISEKARVGLDHKRSPIAFRNFLNQGSCDIVDLKEPCIDIRACKTAVEIAAMKVAHIRDGRALTKALAWIEEESSKGELTELIVDAKIREYREATNVLQDVSFETICGWKSNGAIVHYRVSEKTSLHIQGQGILLLDSGGQYLDGTTDVTRTIALGGEPTAEQKRNFTLVLKGHIGVATAVFPEGVTGAQIDMLARRALWAEGLDYGHGTGHGVGCYLSVHEEATSISPRSNDAIKAGMVISNEPGYYKEGEYGIRIESLVVVVEMGRTLEDGRQLLGFETITMVPLDEKLIDWHILNDEETRWVRDYQEKVKKTLGL